MANRPRARKPRAPRKPFVVVAAPAARGATSAKFSLHFRKALELLSAAPDNPSAAVGYRLLISGYEQLMLAGCIAETPEELFLVGKGRKIGFQSSRKLFVKLQAPAKRR